MIPSKPAIQIKDRIDLRRHKNACPFYREWWNVYGDPRKGDTLYEVICLQGTPPESVDEQEKCMHSKTACWRLREAARAANSPPASRHDLVESDAACQGEL